jgi:RNA polymerase sigma factor (sigma-70 family)
LAARALDGVPAAWDEAARRYSHRVRVALVARGTGWDEAEDLVQETWVRLIRQQQAGRLCSLVLPGLAIAQAGWLAREAQRTHARRESIAGMVHETPAAIEAVVDASPEGDPETTVVRAERLQLIERELAKSPARARDVFRAVYGPEARTHAQVAKVFGLSTQRVAQVACEVRARIRRALAHVEDPS